ncbi:UNVERIFIED_CONTAM: hypothetical protein Slati_3755800 [Sesamum latifolium]|uniref:Uncharacterized protein n=1 Tax=Sesamum latifolium TaxID=2727402 RepID=A0AAW2U7H2_9LAMI
MLLESEVGVLLLLVRPRGPPLLVGRKGKRLVSPLTGIAFEGPAKRTRASSLETPPTGSSRPLATPPPPPPFKEEKGVSFRPSRATLDSLFICLSLEQDEREASSLALTLMRGVVTSKDRHLLTPLPREDLEQKAGAYLMKVNLQSYKFSEFFFNSSVTPVSLYREFLLVIPSFPGPKRFHQHLRVMPRGKSWRRR